METPDPGKSLPNDAEQAIPAHKRKPFLMTRPIRERIPPHIHDMQNDIELKETPPAEVVQEEKAEEENGGYGWVNVGCMFSLNAVTWGVNTTFGVYNSFYIENNYFTGGSPLNYAFIGGLSVSSAMIVAPLANYLTKRFHFKLPMIIGTILLVLGQCCASLSRNYVDLLVTQGLIFGLGLGMAMVPAQPILSQWFTTKLSFASGLGAAGSGFGGVILANTTRAAIQNIGLKWALVTNGVITGVVMVPVIFLYKAKPGAKVKTQPMELKWIWHPGYVWVLIFGAFTNIGYFVALYTMVAFATQGLGISQSQGSALQSILAAGQMIGRPLVGIALDRGGRIRMTALTQFIAGLSCLAIWLPSRSFGVLVLFAIIQGLVGGSVWSAAAPVSAEVVGREHLGSALAIFWLSIVLPVQFAQPIAVALQDYSKAHLGREGANAYLISIGFAGGCFVAAGLALGGAWRYCRIRDRRKEDSAQTEGDAGVHETEAATSKIPSV